jgi:solute carrier family 25 (mitochondrial phosphate transporter), member 23/24/25/41
LFRSRFAARPPTLPIQPAALVAEAAAVDAAASLQAWESHHGGNSPVNSTHIQQQQQQQQLPTTGYSTYNNTREGDLEEDDLEEEEEEEEDLYMHQYRPLKLLAAGGVAGAVSRTATAPIDRVKMLLQVQDTRARLPISVALRRMAAEGTLKAYFKGNGTNVVKIAPETALKLTMNDVFKRIVAEDPDEITPPQRMAAGAAAGATAQSVIYPLELVRTRLVVCPAGTYRGIADCARKVASQEGLKAFYRGMVPSMLGILPYAGVDITTFELLKERLIEDYDGFPPAHMILGAGMLSSSIAQFASYPLALVRTRLQAQGIGGRPVKYKGMMDVLTKTVKNEGFFGLYKGSMTNLLKIAPASGCSWFVFEEMKLALGVDYSRNR